jgi:hypothetical protein
MFIASLVFAQDTTNTKIHFKDTLITKSVDSNQKDIWSVLTIGLPYIISLGGLIIALYTIRNQRKISQGQISVNHIEKRIEGIIDISKNIDKNIFNIFFMKETLRAELKNNHELKVKYVEYVGEEMSEGKLSAFNEIKASSVMIENHDKSLLSSVNELLYWTHLITLYVPIHTENYEDIKLLNKDFTKNINDYFEILRNRKFVHVDIDNEQIILLESVANKFLFKLEVIINYERNNIDNIIIKKSPTEVGI